MYFYILVLIDTRLEYIIQKSKSLPEIKWLPGVTL